MDKMVVATFLLLLLLLLTIITAVTSRLESVQVISYRDSRLTKDGAWMCALDPASETTSSSSLKDCSLKCGRAAICAGFNIKTDTQTCDVYNYGPKLMYPISSCQYYEVCSEWYFLQFLCSRPNKPHYGSCPSVFFVCSVPASNSKAEMFRKKNWHECSQSRCTRSALWGHVTWVCKAVNFFRQLFLIEWFLLFWMCDCKLISFFVFNNILSINRRRN